MTKEEKKAYNAAYYKNNGNAVLDQKKSYYEANKDQIKADRKLYYEKNKEQIKSRVRAYRFSLTKEQVVEFLDRHNNQCYVCKATDKLAIDHDHKCCPEKGVSCGKCLRGVLCFDCNRAIGMLRDDTERLRRAIQYLEGGE